MRICIRVIFAIVLISLVTGCSERLSKDYLLRHPFVLKREIERCHADEKKTRAIAARCEVVMSAAEQFVQLLGDQQSHPAQFGRRIMEAQLEATIAKFAYDEKAKHVVALNRVRADSAELTQAKINAKMAKQAYLEKQHYVESLLAVISVNSPE